MERPKILEEFILEVKRFGVMNAARASGVSSATIKGWVHDKINPTLATAAKVADAMGMEFLLFDKE